MRFNAVSDHKGYPGGRPQGILPGILFGILAGLALLAVTALYAGEGAIYLEMPGLRLKNDPSVVIPAADTYANRPLLLPHYRDPAGRPLDGWSRKYIPTRRFKSDQSAWIYYRLRDLQQVRRPARQREGNGFCIWPGGSLIVIESFQGSAWSRPAASPLEIAVISKADRNDSAYGKAFFAAQWSYARFTPNGDLDVDGAKVRECHQCHSIAFQLTGDLVFTRFP